MESQYLEATQVHTYRCGAVDELSSYFGCRDVPSSSVCQVQYLVLKSVPVSVKNALACCDVR